MYKKKELIKNTAIIGIGVLFAKAISFLLLPFYTMYLSPSEYGVVDLILTYVTYLAPFIILQLDWAVFKYLIDARNDKDDITKITSTSLHFITIMSTASVALLIALSVFVEVPSLPYIIALLLTSIFSVVLLQYARGVGRNTQYAISSIITGLCTALTFFVYVVWLMLGATGVLLSIATAQLAGSLYLFVALKIHRYINVKSIDSGLRKNMLSYSWPLVPEGISWWVINVSDRTIISIVIGVAANGIYAVANKYALILNVAFSVFNLSWTQSISAHINDRDDFVSDVANVAAKLFSSIGLLLIAVLPLVFSLLFNRAYNEAYMYVPILILSNVFYSVAGIYSGIYIAKNLTKQIAKTTIIASIVNIVVNLSLIAHIGVYAAAISTLAAYFLLAIYRHYDVKKFVYITYNKSEFSIIMLLYILIMTLYYINNPLGNIMSTMTTIIAVAILNKSAISFVKRKMLSKIKPLTAEQIVAEEINDSIV